VRDAGEKAVEILTASPYATKLANAGLFLKALASRAPLLPSLIRANLGNQLVGSSRMNMQELVDRAPALEEGKLEQLAALPLGSRVHLDPWTNRVTLLKTKPVALLSVRDKLPFEVTPFIIFLSRVPTPMKEQNPVTGNSVPAQHQ
jgi:hypothetical protein